MKKKSIKRTVTYLLKNKDINNILKIYGERALKSFKDSFSSSMMSCVAWTTEMYMEDAAITLAEYFYNKNK